MLGPGTGDEVADDVLAEHRGRCRRHGRVRARLWVWRQAVWSVVPALRLRGRRRRRRPGHGTWLDARMLDVRGAMRELRRHPGMSLAVVVTLGLGIAASTGVFAIVSNVLLAPLPYDRPERVGILRVDQPAAPDHPLVTGLEYRMVRDAASTAHAAVVVSGFNLARKTPEGPQPVLAGGVGVDLFRVLGVQMHLGRAFLPEDLSDGGRVTVLTWRFWQDEFGGDPEVLGRSLTLGGRPYVVVGILPRDFELFVGRGARGADDAALFFPVPVRLGDTRFATFRTLVRLADGVTWEAAEAELQGIARQVAEVDPENLGGERRYRLVPLHEDVVADVRTPILGLLVAVVLVVLIACLNAAGLLVARGAARGPEYAIRSALGADARRLLTRSFVESGLLTIAATVVGVALGALFVEGLLSRVALDVPRIDGVSVDGWTVALAGLLAGAVTTAVGILPSLHVVRTPIVAALRAGGGWGAVAGRARFGLVVGQIAVTLVLLLGTGLMLRTVDNLRSVDLGFRAEELHTAKLVAPRPPDGEAWWPFFRDVATALVAQPGVRGASVVSRTPLAEQSDVDIVGYGATAEAASEGERRADLRWILPDAFEVVGAELLEGRTFTDQELAEALPVVVVDRLMAERLFPGSSAVGREVHIPRRWGAPPEAARIVGVVEHQRLGGLREPGRPQAFRPASHMTWGVMTLLVRSPLDPSEIARHLRRVTTERGARNLYALTSMDRIVRDLTAGSTLATVTVAGLALVGFVASLVGLWSLLSFLVTRSRREIGVRIALGARPRNVALGFLRKGAVFGAVGVLLGALIAFPLADVIEATLFGVSPRDPAIWAAVTALFLLAATVAAWWPARRASAVDPVESLRSE